MAFLLPVRSQSQNVIQTIEVAPRQRKKRIAKKPKKTFLPHPNSTNDEFRTRYNALIPNNGFQMAKLNRRQNWQIMKPDVTAVVEGQEFYLHKQVLAKESKYFEDRLKMSPNAQLTLHMDPTHVSKDVFQILMIFIYGGAWNCNALNIGPLQHLSLYLGMDRAIAKADEGLSLPKQKKSFWQRMLPCCTRHTTINVIEQRKIKPPVIDKNEDYTENVFFFHTKIHFNTGRNCLPKKFTY
ncbi:hypothetical protein JTE90_002031 [Oedothorax gibbosus]|uniref:BTB domain-containing protein n=1 Tax=Oedothorax gibbosus TaxID=931172 RepID=A0AAV6UMY7_9ARAC|nr:hypothetical protein JTE90_002031 [Oedothorax gibbosus]